MIRLLTEVVLGILCARLAYKHVCIAIGLREPDDEEDDEDDEDDEWEEVEISPPAPPTTPAPSTPAAIRKP